MVIYGMGSLSNQSFTSVSVVYICEKERETHFAPVVDEAASKEGFAGNRQLFSLVT